MSITREEYFKRIEDRERQRAERIADGREIPPPYVSEIRAPVTDSKGRTRSDRISQGLSPTEEQRTTEGELLASKKSPSAPTPEPKPDKKVLVIDEQGRQIRGQDVITYDDPIRTIHITPEGKKIPETLGVAYRGEVTKRIDKHEDETQAQYERRVSQILDIWSQEEAQRLAEKKPGKIVRTGIRYESPITREIEKPKVASVQTTQEPGITTKEPLSKSPEYVVSFPQRSIGDVSHSPKTILTSAEFGAMQPVISDSTQVARVSPSTGRVIGGVQPLVKPTFTEKAAFKIEQTMQRIGIGASKYEDLSKERFALAWRDPKVTPVFGAGYQFSKFVSEDVRSFLTTPVKGAEGATYSKGPDFVIGAGAVMVSEPFRDPLKYTALFATGTIVGAGVGVGAGATTGYIGGVIRGSPKLFRASQRISPYVSKAKKGALIIGGTLIGGAVTADIALSSDPQRRAGVIAAETVAITPGFKAMKSAYVSVQDKVSGRVAERAWRKRFDKSTEYFRYDDVGVGQRTLTGVVLDESLLIRKSPLGLPPGVAFKATSPPPSPETTRMRIFLDYEKQTGKFLLRTRTLIKDRVGKIDIPGFATQVTTETGRTLPLQQYGVRMRGFEPLRLSVQDVKTGTIKQMSQAEYADLIFKDPGRFRLLSAEDITSVGRIPGFGEPKPSVQTQLKVVWDSPSQPRLTFEVPKTDTKRIKTFQDIFADKKGQARLQFPELDMGKVVERVDLGVRRGMKFVEGIPTKITTISPSIQKPSLVVPSPSSLFKEDDPRIDFGVERTSVIQEDMLSSAKIAPKSDVKHKALNVVAFAPAFKQELLTSIKPVTQPISGVRSRVKSGLRIDSKIGTDVVTDTDLVTVPRISTIIKTPPPPSPPRQPPRRPPGTTPDPTPKPKLWLPTRSRVVSEPLMPKQPRKGFFGALKTARPGSKFIIAPGRKKPGVVRTIKLGGKSPRQDEGLLRRKKKKDWWWL